MGLGFMLGLIWYWFEFQCSGTYCYYDKMRFGLFKLYYFVEVIGSNMWGSTTNRRMFYYCYNSWGLFGMLFLFCWFYTPLLILTLRSGCISLATAFIGTSISTLTLTWPITIFLSLPCLFYKIYAESSNYVSNPLITNLLTFKYPMPI